MPRKKKEELINETNEPKVLEEVKVESSTKKKSTSVATSKKAAASNNVSAKKNTTSKKATAKVDSEKVSKSTKKTSSKSTNSGSKSKSTKSSSTKSVEKEKKTSTSGKKSTSKTSKKSSSSSTKSKSKKASTTKKPALEVVEYYDLPYRYNQTVIKILYQTPTTLFIYWDISDEDRKNFVNQYGENFFNDTKPVLIVHNDTLHYSFEIEINDFANSWYLHVNDSNCQYSVELGRRPKYYGNDKNINIPNDYVYVSYSNEIESPNDHVLFNKDLDTVYFKDVKTNIVTAESVTSLSFIRNMGRIYSLYDLHTNFNKNNWMDSNRWQLDLTNPSSGNPSSTFK